jgi:hypothetical protein
VRVCVCMYVCVCVCGGGGLLKAMVVEDNPEESLLAPQSIIR